MSDAPERITIHYCTACGTYPVFLCLCDIEDGEEIGKADYIHADIHNAENARLRGALEEIITQSKELGTLVCYCGSRGHIIEGIARNALEDTQ